MFDHEIPVGFIGQPEDVAAAVVYFASDEARYVTGQVLFVDGGTGVRMFLGVTDKKSDKLSDVKALEKEEDGSTHA